MNRPSFYLSLFRYAVMRPIDGFRILQTAYEVREDFKHKLDADIETIGLQDCLKSLFPSLGRIEKNTLFAELEEQLHGFFEKIKLENCDSNNFFCCKFA